jgi:SRSO17 transposase
MAAFVRGLLAGLPRVNCWTVAEHAGERCPRGMQRLLSSAVWDEAGMRDDLRGYVLEHFADPAAVLVVDETGDLKKGTMSVGVQRQYTGTAGRTENAQVAVYLAYAARSGSAFTGRALYLPRSWTCDPARCAAAGVPGDTAFATKPALAQEMITRALDAGTPAGWVAGDEVYGQDPQLRAELARRGLGYVLAIRKSGQVLTPAGPLPAAELAKRLPARAWQRLSAGPGAKGPRWYDRALIEAADPAVTEGGGPHWLLIRRRISDGELAFYRAHAPHPVPPCPARARARGRVAVEGRERVRRRQGANRPGRAPGPVLDLLAPVDHPGPARPRLLVRPGQPGRRQPPGRRAADPADPPRDPPPAHRPVPQLAAPAAQLHWSRWRRGTRPPPGTVTTADEPKHPHDHELSLELVLADIGVLRAGRIRCHCAGTAVPAPVRCPAVGSG